MRIFAIGDLHLPGGDKKPMDVFGAHWENHFERISADWRAKVADEDIVLIPGDISWAMQLSCALEDLRRIALLPGRKLILRGNHDFWWSSLTQLRCSLPEGMHAVQNDAYDAGDVVFCGTRGWTLPQMAGGEAAQPGQQISQDEKLYRREAMRLEMSLKAARRMAGERPVFAMMHYPPLLPEYARTGTEFTRLMSEYGVARCVYGHLHGPSVQRGYNGLYNGVQYDLVSCDALGFALREVSL
ncbi:MAG: metallophosphoesterase [Clostridia bacterium]|nr:metallophosphoesterase [Clostridia bacterium]